VSNHEGFVTDHSLPLCAIFNIQFSPLAELESQWIGLIAALALDLTSFPVQNFW
jgi:hypothetical protein